jgi:Flp pilus assembly protein TadG
MGRPVKTKSRSRGIAVLLTSVSIVGAVSVVGLAVDVGMMYAIKTKLSAAVDAAALAGARQLGQGGGAGASAASTAYFNANMTPGYMMSQNINSTVTGPTVVGTTTQMTVSGQATLPLMFLRMLSFVYPSVQNQQVIAYSATAVRQNINMVIVLDRSGSMGRVDPLSATGQTACQEMVAAAEQFTGNYVNGTDNLGLIVFGGSYYAAFPIANDFKTGSPSINTQIAAISCGGNTGSAQALTQATNMLNGLPTTATTGALNVIVFFTDGQPNGLSADWPIATKAYLNLVTPGWGNASTPAYPNSSGGNSGVTSTSTLGWYRGYVPSGCTGATGTNPPTITGVVARNGEVNTGIYGMSTGSSGPSDAGAVGGAGCAFTSATNDFYGNNMQSRVHEDIAYIPPTDHYGNVTTGYWSSNFVYPTVGPFKTLGPMLDYYATGTDPVGNPNGLFQNNVDIASMNAAEAAANTARTNANFPILIFSIGLGGAQDIFPGAFLEHVANTTTSDLYNVSQPSGQYIYVTGPSQLGSAFQSVASYVQRLTS